MTTVDANLVGIGDGDGNRSGCFRGHNLAHFNIVGDRRRVRQFHDANVCPAKQLARLAALLTEKPAGFEPVLRAGLSGKSRYVKGDPAGAPFSANVEPNFAETPNWLFLP